MQLHRWMAVEVIILSASAPPSSHSSGLEDDDEYNDPSTALELSVCGLDQQGLGYSTITI